METQRFNGGCYSVHMDGTEFDAHKFSLEITDNSAVATKGGLPNGVLIGDCSASGTLTVDADEFAKIEAMAKKAGSYQMMPTVDMMGYAKVGKTQKKVEAFGCKLKLGSVVDADASNTDEDLTEIPFDVTSRDFVKINGTPYKKYKNK